MLNLLIILTAVGAFAPRSLASSDEEIVQWVKDTRRQAKALGAKLHGVCENHPDPKGAIKNQARTGRYP